MAQYVLYPPLSVMYRKSTISTQDTVHNIPTQDTLHNSLESFHTTRVGKFTMHDCEIMTMFTVGRQKISKFFSYQIAKMAVIPSGYCARRGMILSRKREQSE